MIYLPVLLLVVLNVLLFLDLFLGFRFSLVDGSPNAVPFICHMNFFFLLFYFCLLVLYLLKLDKNLILISVLLAAIIQSGLYIQSRYFPHKSGVVNIEVYDIGIFSSNFGWMIGRSMNNLEQRKELKTYLRRLKDLEEKRFEFLNNISLEEALSYQYGGTSLLEAVIYSENLDVIDKTLNRFKGKIKKDQNEIFRFCVEKGNLNLLKILTKYQLRFSSSSNSAFFLALERNDKVMAKALLFYLEENDSKAINKHMEIIIDFDHDQNLKSAFENLITMKLEIKSQGLLHYIFSTPVMYGDNIVELLARLGKINYKFTKLDISNTFNLLAGEDRLEQVKKLKTFFGENNKGY